MCSRNFLTGVIFFGKSVKKGFKLLIYRSHLLTDFTKIKLSALSQIFTELTVMALIIFS